MQELTHINKHVPIEALYYPCASPGTAPWMRILWHITKRSPFQACHYACANWGTLVRMRQLRNYVCASFGTAPRMRQFRNINTHTLIVAPPHHACAIWGMPLRMRLLCSALRMRHFRHVTTHVSLEVRQYACAKVTQCIMHAPDRAQQYACASSGRALHMRQILRITAWVSAAHYACARFDA